jgi:hypothetical protein
MIKHYCAILNLRWIGKTRARMSFRLAAAKNSSIEQIIDHSASSWVADDAEISQWWFPERFRDQCTKRARSYQASIRCVDGLFEFWSAFQSWVLGQRFIRRRRRMITNSRRNGRFDALVRLTGPGQMTRFRSQSIGHHHIVHTSLRHRDTKANFSSLHWKWITGPRLRSWRRHVDPLMFRLSIP